VVELIAPHCQKITFVGGEPTLCPFPRDLIEARARLGLTTASCRTARLLFRPSHERQREPRLDRALSVDSADEEVACASGAAPAGT